MSGAHSAAANLTLEESSSNGAAKPRFLLSLEAHLASELRKQALLPTSTTAPAQSSATSTAAAEQTSLPRVNLFRQILLQFSQEFQTYRPLLSRIVHEFDLYFTHTDQQLDRIPSLLRTIGTMDDRWRAVLTSEKNAWKIQEKKLTEALQQNQMKVVELEQKFYSLTQAHTTLSTEHAALKKNHHDLSESNSLLKKALTRFNREKTMAWEEKVTEGDLNKKLNAQILEMQKHQEALLQEITLIRSHASSIQNLNLNPEEYERMSEECRNLNAQLNQWKEKYQGRTNEYLNLMLLHEQTAKESAELKSIQASYENDKRASTPRPVWKRLLNKNYLPSSCNLELQSTESLIDELCSEIDRLRLVVNNWEMKYPSEGELDAGAGMAQKDEPPEDREAAKFLKLRGNTEDVPLYLRFGKAGQKIRNKNINKRETEIFIKDVWKAKLHTPENQGGEEYRKMSLEEFLYVFLKKHLKLGFQEAIVNYAYSILDSLDRFRFDGDCDLFLQILQKQVSENVYVDQFQMLEDLKKEFEKMDGEYHKGKLRGRLPRKIILDVLKSFFHTKSELNLKKMNHSLFVQDKTEVINYRALFEEDREGNQGAFLECIRDQHLSEIKEFSAQIHEKLLEKAKRYDGFLRINQIREILLVLDPSKPAKEVEAYLREGLDLNKPLTHSNNAAPTSISAVTEKSSGVKSKDKDSSASASPAQSAAPILPDLPSDTEPIDPELFFTNLNRRLLKRSGAPPIDRTAMLHRKGSLSMILLGPTQSTTASALSSQVVSGRNTPDKNGEEGAAATNAAGTGSLSPPPAPIPPAHKLRGHRSAQSSSGMVSASASTPSTPSATAMADPFANAPNPRVGKFSALARKISLSQQSSQPKKFSIANIIQQVKANEANNVASAIQPSTMMMESKEQTNNSNVSSTMPTPSLNAASDPTTASVTPVAVSSSPSTTAQPTPSPPASPSVSTQDASPSGRRGTMARRVSMDRLLSLQAVHERSVAAMSASNTNNTSEGEGGNQRAKPAEVIVMKRDMSEPNVDDDYDTYEEMASPINNTKLAVASSASARRSSLLSLISRDAASPDLDQYDENDLDLESPRH